MKLKLYISYVGTNYCGWQLQDLTHTNIDEYRPTIQAELEKAFEELFKAPTRIYGASRTDSGVHAEEQIAHCVLPFEPKNITWERAINNLLPHDIRVNRAELVDDTFHAQFNSIGKVYTYSLWTNPIYTPPKIYPYTWSCQNLHRQDIETAISYLIGKQDFKSFQNAGTSIEKTVRILEQIEIQEISEFQLDFIFKGNGFLKQMVRNIMGLLVYVGRGRIKHEQVPEIITNKERTSLFPTAPAKGLSLTKVIY